MNGNDFTYDETGTPFVANGSNGGSFGIGPPASIFRRLAGFHSGIFVIQNRKNLLIAPT